MIERQKCKLVSFTDVTSIAAKKKNKKTTKKNNNSTMLHVWLLAIIRLELTDELKDFFSGTESKWILNTFDFPLFYKNRVFPVIRMESMLFFSFCLSFFSFFLKCIHFDGFVFCFGFLSLVGVLWLPAHSASWSCFCLSNVKYAIPVLISTPPVCPQITLISFFFNKRSSNVLSR